MSDPRALVLGLGDSGLAIARWLARQGWSLRVADTRAAPPQLDALHSAAARRRACRGQTTLIALHFQAGLAQR